MTHEATCQRLRLDGKKVRVTMKRADLPDPKLEEIEDGVFAYIQPDGSWWINNTGLVVGDALALGIDACATERRTRNLIDNIRKATPAPVRLLLNTHHHGDHTFGNSYFTEATVIAHEETRRLMFKQRPPPDGVFWEPVEWGDLPLAPPVVTYSEGVDIWVDEERVEIRHVGFAAHTSNDSFAWVPARGVLFAGDLVFSGGTPFIMNGSLAGALRALDQLRSLGPKKVVPGHGPVCGPEVFDATERYLRFVSESAVRARAGGLSPLEAALELDLGDYREWLDPERIVGNLHRAYFELEHEKPGQRFDASQALADMISFNDGKPLRCHA